VSHPVGKSRNWFHLTVLVILLLQILLKTENHRFDKNDTGFTG